MPLTGIWPSPLKDRTSPLSKPDVICTVIVSETSADGLPTFRSVSARPLSIVVAELPGR